MIEQCGQTLGCAIVHVRIYVCLSHPRRKIEGLEMSEYQNVPKLLLSGFLMLHYVKFLTVVICPIHLAKL